MPNFTPQICLLDSRTLHRLEDQPERWYIHRRSGHIEERMWRESFAGGSPCLRASAVTTQRFTPGDLAHYLESEQAILRKRQKKRLHLCVELHRLLGRHAFQRETTASVMSRNVVLDRLSH